MVKGYILQVGSVLSKIADCYQLASHITRRVPRMGIIIAIIHPLTKILDNETMSDSFIIETLCLGYFPTLPEDHDGISDGAGCLADH
jgi:hypothetical protein